MSGPGDGQTPFRVLPALAWAASWGVGAGLGVGAGAWLTVVGEAGAPGVEALDPGSDLLILPLLAFLAVTVVHLVAQSLAAAFRSLRERRRSPMATASDETDL